MEIWVDPACSTCRAATAALDEAGVASTVRRYPSLAEGWVAAAATGHRSA